MGLQIKSLLIILCLICIKSAGANEILFDKKFDGIQRVEFNRHDRGHNKITNVFLQKISAANGTLRVFTGYNINYSLQIRLHKTGEENANLKIFLTSLTFDGDINYRDFPVAELLIPSNVDIGMQLLFNGEASALDLDTDIPVDVENTPMIYSKPVKIPAENDLRFDIQLSDLLFYYDDKALQKFKAWEEVLYTYYESVNKLDVIENNLMDLHPETPGRIIMDEFRFCEAERLFWDVYHAPFINVLDLENSDPAGFKCRFDLLMDSVLYYRERFNYNLSRLDELYYFEGLQKYKAGDWQKALEKFRLAIVYNPVHLPSHLSATDIFLKKGDIDSAAVIISEVINEMHPRGDYLDSSLVFVEQVYDSYFTITDSLNIEGKHVEALKISEKAKAFDKKVHIIDKSYEVDKRYTDAHTGVYESFLEVVSRAITAINHSYALTYIDHAIDYQYNNSKFIKGGDRIYGYVEQLVDHLITTGRQLYVMKDFKGAETIFSDVIDICAKYPMMDCKDDVSNYLALASEARREAELLTVEVTIKEPLPAMRNDDVVEQVKDEMLKNLSHGHLKAWAGETNEARRVLEDITEKSAMYGLRSDSLINARLVSLSKRIREKECELAERDLETLMVGYFQLIDEDEFIKANNKLSEMKSLTLSKKECDFDDGKIYEEKERIRPVVSYLEKMEKVRDLYFSQAHSDYEFFVKTYIKTDEFYIENEIKNFGISHKVLFDFIISSSDQSLILYGVSYYSREYQPGKALDLLYRLKEMGVERDRTAGMQEYAGMLAAQYYAAVYPDSTARELLSEFTDNDRWFRDYNRAFMNHWDP